MSTAALKTTMHFRASPPALLPATCWNKQCRNAAPWSINEGVHLPQTSTPQPVTTSDGPTQESVTSSTEGACTVVKP
ncbi:MAG: hypothetical protein ACO1TE_23560 [Prosthecobacter sp.]